MIASGLHFDKWLFGLEKLSSFRPSFRDVPSSGPTSYLRDLLRLALKERLGTRNSEMNYFIHAYRVLISVRFSILSL